MTEDWGQLADSAESLHREIEEELAGVASLGDPRGVILAELERDRSRVNVWNQTCDEVSLCTCCCRFPVKPRDAEHYYIACATCVEINRIASRSALASPLAPFEQRIDGTKHLHLAVDPDDKHEDFDLRIFADFVLDWCASPEMSFAYRSTLAAERAFALPEGALEWPDLPASLWRRDVEDAWTYCVSAYLACIQHLLPGVMSFHSKLAGVLAGGRESSYPALGAESRSSR